MAINLFPTSGNPAIAEFLHTEDTIQAIDDTIITGNDCSFCLNGCTKDIPVFAYSLDGDDSYKNDFSSYITEAPEGGAVIGTLIRIETDGSETEYVITDDTYGTFYALSVMRDNVWGFILDWFKVSLLLGNGWYKFNLKVENVATTVIVDKTTPCYRLKPYSCQAAHRTVRIETEQSGYIEDGFDYRNLARPDKLTRVSPWPQQIRWYGKFWALAPTLLTDNLVDNKRNSLQVQAQIIDNFQLRLEFIQTTVSKHFFKDNLLANKILISDYNRNNPEVYDNVRVNPVDITDRITHNLNKNEIFNVTLEEYQKNTLKRN